MLPDKHSFFSYNSRFLKLPSLFYKHESFCCECATRKTLLVNKVSPCERLPTITDIDGLFHLVGTTNIHRIRSTYHRLCWIEDTVCACYFKPTQCSFPCRKGFCMRELESKPTGNLELRMDLPTQQNDHKYDARLAVQDVLPLVLY